MKWTKDENEVLLNNYHLGAEYISTILKNRNRLSIQHKMSRMGLKVSKETKSLICKKNSGKRNFDDYQYKVDDFTKDINEYKSYILGLIWTDGYLLKSRKTVSITMVKEDLEEIDWIFNKIGLWYKSDRKRVGKKESRTMSAYNPNLLDSLIDIGFDKKSFISPEKLFEIIPNNYIKYLIRGIIDGDGCFYTNKKNYTYQLSISSTYDQDWSFYIDFFNKMGLDFKVQKRVHKKSKSSIIRLCKRESVVELCKWLYDDYENDKIGLYRKYSKSLSFIK